MFQVGDPLVILQGQQVGAGITKHTFTCPSTCTQRSDVPLTIFGEGLHMVCPNKMLPLQSLSCLLNVTYILILQHAIGATMNHRLVRNNEVVHENTVQYFDFEQSGAYVVPQDSYVLEPGDSMETECFYKDSINGNVKFGLSSSDEMCITFLWYFPKRNLEFCGYNIFFDNDCLGSYNRETLDDEGEIGRTFGIERQVTTSPTRGPSKHPSVMPTVTMTKEPTAAPSNKEISAAPSSDQRSISPTRSPSSYPSIMPTVTKTNEPSNKDTSVVPSSMPTAAKTDEPTDAPSNKESSTAPSSNQISVAPTQSPSRYPSMMPSLPKTNEPTVAPSNKDLSAAPSSNQSSITPTRGPSTPPTLTKSNEPTGAPSNKDVSIVSSGDVPSSSSFRVLSTVNFSTVLFKVLIVGIHLYLVQE